MGRHGRFALLGVLLWLDWGVMAGLWCAAGATAVVWASWDTVNRKRVALKVIVGR